MKIVIVCTIVVACFAALAVADYYGDSMGGLGSLGGLGGGFGGGFGGGYGAGFASPAYVPVPVGKSGGGIGSGWGLGLIGLLVLLMFLFGSNNGNRDQIVLLNTTLEG